MPNLKIEIQSAGKIKLTFQIGSKPYPQVDIAHGDVIHAAVKAVLETFYLEDSYPLQGKKLTETHSISGKDDIEWMKKFIDHISAAQAGKRYSGGQLHEFLTTTLELPEGSYGEVALCNIGNPSPRKELKKGTIINLATGRGISDPITVSIANGHGIDKYTIEDGDICRIISSCLHKALPDHDYSESIEFLDERVRSLSLPEKNTLSLIKESIKNLVLGKGREKETLFALDTIDSIPFNESFEKKDILILYVNDSHSLYWRDRGIDEGMLNLSLALRTKKMMRGHDVKLMLVQNKDDLQTIPQEMQQRGRSFDQVCFVGHCQIHLVPDEGSAEEKPGAKKEVRPKEERHAGGFSHAEFGQFCYQVQKLTQAKELKFFMCEMGIDPGREIEEDAIPEGFEGKRKNKHKFIDADKLDEIMREIEADPKEITISTMSLLLAEMHKEWSKDLDPKKQPSLNFRATAPNGALLMTLDTEYKWDAIDMGQYNIASDSRRGLGEIERDARKTLVQYHVNTTRTPCLAELSCCDVVDAVDTARTTPEPCDERAAVAAAPNMALAASMPTLALLPTRCIS